MSNGRAAHETAMEGPAEVEVEVWAIEDWRAEVQRRWEELGRDVFGLAPSRRTFMELSKELEVLVCIVTWFDEGGNITAAAKRCDVGRKTLRDRVKVWKERCPHLVPQSPRRVRTEAEAVEARRVRQKERYHAKKRAQIAKKRERSVAERWAQAGAAPKPQGGQ